MDSDREVDVIDMAMNVRVDTITAIDLDKQTFTADLWVFIMTAKPPRGGVKKKVEEFLRNFDPNEKRPGHWIASQNLITAASSEDHPKPDLYEKDGQIGLAWRREEYIRISYVQEGARGR